jgi:Outer membrane protein beta-barrel domain
MTRIIRVILMACVCCGVSAGAWAQADVRANEWSRGTTLNGFAGVAVDSSQRGPAVGGAVGWEVTPGLAIEGSGSWVEFGHGTNAFGGALKVRARLFGHRRVDPFVQGGVGLYRATFGPGDTEVPAFYQRRLTGQLTGRDVGRTFTDPTLVGGGGVSLFVNRHVAVRPEVEAAVALDSGRAHLVTTIGVHLVYHFESHPVTPARVR